jgi:hypothetical protein
MEKYSYYVVDIDGNVWSTKFNKLKKLKPGWAKHKDGYRFVRLTSDDKKLKNFFIHRLVALAFIATDTTELDVVHKNKILYDNRVENLFWTQRTRQGKLQSRKKKVETEKYVIDQFKNIHTASIRKGMTVPTDEEFMQSIINGAIENYINQYGLRKILHTL